MPPDAAGGAGAATLMLLVLLLLLEGMPPTGAAWSSCSCNQRANAGMGHPECLALALGWGAETSCADVLDAGPDAL